MAARASTGALRSPPSSTWIALVSSLLLIALLPLASAVKRHDFKTCSQSGFCSRNRALAERAGEAGDRWSSPYEVVNSSFSAGSLTASLKNALFPQIAFSFEVRLHENGVARVIVDEVNGLRQRYNEAAKWAVETEPAVQTDEDNYKVDISPARTSVTYAGGRHEVRVEHKPVLVTFLRDGQPHLVLNERGLFNMEHFRVKQVGGEPEELVVQDPEHPEEQLVVIQDEAFPGFLPPNEDGMWEETFTSKRDSKPKGPESLSLDITFPGYAHVYGIPEHASSLSLKQTRGGDGAYTDPYRLYNLDVFEYDTDSEMALYGSVPFMQAHRAGSTVGVFLVSGSEVWVDVTKSATPKAVTSAWKNSRQSKSGEGDEGPASTTTTTHWMAESGILDLFVFLGPTPSDVLDQYTSLTGRAPLPQYAGLGYHQCRWNYIDEADVEAQSVKFDEADVPLDYIWLDIEYANEKRYFVWDERNFPTPEKMQEKLAGRGRKLIAIVDPHIKRADDYYVFKEGQELDVFVKQPNGKDDLDGWCWPGSSSWVDWFNPKAYDWFIGLWKFDKFKGSTKHLHAWIDMNEPSVFNGPEITMQKDAVQHGGWEHRDVHNIGGMIYQNVTMNALTAREEVPKRPFVLGRAYFAGSQRYGAIWTGDNLGTWQHLASTIPMLLSNGISGIVYAGSDVGGFFGNPSAEMITRWHQIGTFSPFFRAHGHIDTKRREVYLWDQPYQGIMRDAIRLRYQLLPVFYTAFKEASLTGAPILRPQYFVFPNDPKGFALDDQFYLGSSGLLAKPVAAEGATSQEIYISDDQPYYHYISHDIYFGASHGGATVKVPAPLESIPVLQRGGHILPRRDLVRRSSILAWRDPITLVAAVDLTGTSAEGSIYLDDGETFDAKKGDYVYREFKLEAKQAGSKTLVLRSRNVDAAGPADGLAKYDPSSNAYAQKISDVVVREIVLLGLPSKPTCIKAAGASLGLEFDWKDGVGATAARRSSGKVASVLTIKDADLAIIRDFDLVFEFDSSSSCSTTPAVDHEAALQSPQCLTGKHYCANEGHIPACILRSRLNDGICDPECCDGSDETDGKVHCPNRCAAVGAEYRKTKAEEARKRRVGASIRNDYIKHGAKEKAKLEEEVGKVEQEIARLRAKEQEAQTKLEQLENEVAGETERKKDSQLFQRIVEMQAAIKALRLHRANLEGHIADLSGILGDLSRDFNPNYQDMAVLGATRAYKDWRTSNGLSEENAADENGETVDVPAQQNLPDGEVADDYSDDDLQALEEEDPLSLIDSLSTRVGSPIVSSVSNIFRLDDYVPDKFRPQYDSYKKALLDTLTRFGLIYPPVLTDKADRPELARARTAHQNLFDDIRKQENKLDEAKEALKKDWGPDWEWKKLDGTCVELNTGEYTYSVCFLGEAHQKSNNNNQRTSLGRFKGWSETAEQGSEAYYQKQVYADGQRCWNGPARSAKVDLVCGTSNALLSVMEPEKCEYLFKVSTPAVCFPQADDDESHPKDEL